MFFPPRVLPPKVSPSKKTEQPRRGMPFMTGIPGLHLNLSVDHMQLLGTVVMMGLARRPGFKEELEQMMAFMKQMQEAAEAITVQMETVQQEFKKVQAKVAERTESQIMPKHEGGTYINPLLHHLLSLMS